MGFFASELGAALSAHGESWACLGARFGVHQQQVERLMQAEADPFFVSTLQRTACDQVAKELDFSPLEIARMVAGGEADTFFRLMIYHNYPIEEAMNKSNSVFAAALRDHMANPLNVAGSIYPDRQQYTVSLPQSPEPKKRGRKKRSDALTKAASEVFGNA